METSVTDAPTPTDGQSFTANTANLTYTPPATTTSTYTAPAGFTEADLAKAREQEKAKLYPQMDQLKTELSEAKSQLEEFQKAQREAQERAEAEAKAKAEEEMDIRSLLQTKEQEWEQRLEAERLEREQAFALLEKERALSQITEYRNAKLAEVGDDIIPELRDLVTGNSAEEIDQSIAGLVERSSRILEGAQAAMQQARQSMQGTRVTAPSTELDTNSGQRQFSPEEIAAMPMAEYQKYRSSLLGQAANNTNRGLFG